MDALGLASLWVAVGSLLIAAIALVAAGLSAKYAKHQRDAAREANRLLRLERAERAAAPWAVGFFEGEKFALTNGWAYPLFEVQVIVPWSAPSGPRSWDMVDPAATVTFMVTATEVGGSGDMEVQWKEELDGEVRSWRTVLPPRR